MCAGEGGSGSARAASPPARPPLALRAVPAPRSRASPCALLSLLPPCFSISVSFLSRTLFAFYCSPPASLPPSLFLFLSHTYTHTHTHIHTPRPTIVHLHLRKGPDKGAEPAPGPRGQPGRGGAANRRGQPVPSRLPGGPGKPGRRLLTNFLPGRTRANSPCAGGAAPGGPRGRPCRAVGRLPGAAPSSSRSLDRGGARGGGRPACAPCGSPRSRSGPRGKCVQSWSHEPLGPSPPDPDQRGRPWGCPGQSPRPWILALAGQQQARRLPAQAARGPKGVPAAATAAGATVPSTSHSALCPRSRPTARVPQARPAPSQPPPPPLPGRGGICAGRGLLSRPLPPAALLKAFNPPGAASGGN